MKLRQSVSVPYKGCILPLYNGQIPQGDVMVVIIWELDLLLSMQSVPITTNVVSLNPANGEVYLI
jgi:hypothetical protein